MLRKKIRFGLGLAAAVWFSWSCAVTRHVPEGSYLLDRNVIETDKDAPRRERIKGEEFEQYLRQRTNKRLLGMRIPLWVYNVGNPEKNTWWSRAWRRIGEPPAVLDTALVRRSAANMETYMHTRGFFDADQRYTIDTSGRKAIVTYHATQGKPYYIHDIRYDFQDRFLRSVVMQDSARTLLRTGDIFDIGVLDRERLRITQNLKRQGYYNFTINNIGFVADSTVGDRRVNLTMVVKQYLSGYDEQGMPQYGNNAVFRLRNIYIHPDHDPAVALADLPREPLDTLEYEGLYVVSRESPRIRPGILRRVVNLQSNSLYNADEVKRAYDQLMRLGYFRSASILFTERTDTTAASLVTFIGGGDGTAAYTTTQGYLDCVILCTPALRQSYRVEAEATTTSNFYGLAATIGYQNRNLFRGAELLDVSVRGGYEFMRTKGKKSSYEIGATASLSFPRFITPLRVDPFGRLSNPRTKFEASINSQRRPYYHRVLSGLNWGYSWGNGRHTTYTLRPVDLSLVRMGFIDEGFLTSLRNPYLLHSYESQLIPAISGSYVYNNQISRIDRNVLNLRVNAETAGNLFSAAAHLFSDRKEGVDHYELFGIRYAQYVRADASVSYKFVLGPRTSLVYRLYGGIGIAYANSLSLPFDRLFYAGGSNSMRGWLARTLGPGNSPAPPDDTYPSQLGNMKLETNLEFRFPVWGFLNGALFLDAGNIWLTRRDADTEEGAVFRLDSFASRLGFNTGIGGRFDFNFFVLRVDWGIRLHDPNRTAHERWIRDFRFRNTALHFGVGYPF